MTQTQIAERVGIHESTCRGALWPESWHGYGISCAGLDLGEHRAG